MPDHVAWRRLRGDGSGDDDGHTSDLQRIVLNRMGEKLESEWFSKAAWGLVVEDKQRQGSAQFQKELCHPEAIFLLKGNEVSASGSRKNAGKTLR